MLRFDEASHTYFWKGAEVPGVSKILREIGDDPLRFAKPEHLERGRDLGTAVHRMIELDIRGTLEETSLVGPLVGYYEQWRDFLHRTGFVPIQSEIKLYSERYGYAGTLDLFGDLAGDLLIDTKAGQVPLLARPQTAGYANLLVENGYSKKPRRRVLDLKERKWNFSEEYKDPRDFNVFLAALTIFRWKEANNMTRGR